MKRELLIGEVAAQAGVSRKAVRVYETAGIVVPRARTAAGYRVYGAETLALLSFVVRARGLGLSLAEIRELVALRRAGRTPCPQVRALARRKLARLDRELAELVARRDRLRDLVAARPARSAGAAAVCPAIECSHEAKSTTRRVR